MNTRSDYWRNKLAFEELLEVPPEARIAYLAQLAQAEPALSSALASRLANYATSVAQPEQLDIQTSPNIAGYTVIAATGSGGMGKVWLVHRASEPEQKLALKQLHAEQPDAELVRRFAQERRALARLNHPHIAALVDAGLDDQGRPYLVTSWVEGARIDHWCDRNQADIRERVRLVRDIAAALSHAHGQMIVHRDLKPANVLVDSNRQVRLVDFGIAKLMDLAEGEHVSTGLPIMTLRYAAPEQVSGAVIGPPCDLYALGVLLFELISGQSPYGDCNHPSALANAVANTEPPAPVLMSTLANVGNQRDLSAIVLKLLRKRPQDRYGSAQELTLELNRWLAGAPVDARSDERGYLLRRRLYRWRFGLAAAALLLGVLSWHLWRLDQQLQQTELQRDRARAVADFFVQLFRQSGPGEAREGDISARALLDRGVAELTKSDTNLSADTRSLLQWVSARVYADLGMVREAEPLLQRAIKQLQRQQPIPVDELIEAHRTYARVLYQLDRVKDSLASSLTAVDLLERAGETNSERYAGMLQNAAIAAAINDQNQANVLLERALAVLERNQDQMRHSYVLMLLNMGGEKAANLQHSEALTYYARATQAIQALQPMDVDLQLNLQRGALESRLELGPSAQEWPSVHAELKAASTKAFAHYGQDHLETAFWHVLAGMAAAQSERLFEAEHEFAAAESIGAKLFDESSHDHRRRFALNLALVRAARAPRAENTPAQFEHLLALDAPDYAPQIKLLRALAHCQALEPSQALDGLQRWQRKLSDLQSCQNKAL